MKLNLQPVITRLENGCDVKEAIAELKIYQQSLDDKYKITSLGITRAASFWYPTMLAHEVGEISESRAAELLGVNIEEYREKKWIAVLAVIELCKNLPVPLVSIIDEIKNNPEFLTTSVGWRISDEKRD